MSRKEAIRGLTVDLNVFESGSLQFSFLAKRGRDIDLEDSGRVLFQPVATEKPSLSDIHCPIHEPEPIGGNKAMQRRSIVGTEDQRPHRLENPMDLAETEGSFRFWIDAVDPIEGKKNIIEALTREQEFTGIHDFELDSLNELGCFLDHLRNEVDACNRMTHSLEKKARSSAAAADVQDPTRRPKMEIENPFFHGEKIELTVLFQRLLAGKSFLIPQFLLGEIHRPRFPVLVAQGILMGFCRFLKEFFGTALRGAGKEIARL
jgi:hypothetical protein